MEYDCVLKLLLAGDDGVGKTALLQRFAHDVFIKTYTATIGIDFAVKIVSYQGKKIKLQIFDIAGQERFKTITSAYYRGCQGVLLVYDITNQESLNNLSERWIPEIKQHGDMQLLLVGTKSDIEDRRVVDFDTAKTFADDGNLTYMETSTKNSSNVSEVFLTLVEEIMKNRSDDHIAAKPVSVQAPKKQRKKSPDVKGSRTCSIL